MCKKTISFLLALVMAVSLCVPCFAAEAGEKQTLKFRADGNFTIIHLTDFHQHYPLDPLLKQYVIETLDTVKPDLVVLGGDIAGDVKEAPASCPNPLEECIRQICELFTERKVPFTITFGNHDRQSGKSGPELLEYYERYGGVYFLGSDAVPELTGCGTHDLPILSSDGKKVAFNLYMFDSGDSVFDEEGNYLGYDSVHTDQIEWYKNRAAQLKADNGGVPVPSMAFQHIIVEEIYDALHDRVNNSVGALGMDFYDGHYILAPIPKIQNIKSGVYMEKCYPGYYNFGQFEEMRRTGDVIAIFSGHDHSNTFTVNVDGIDIVNTGGCKYQAPLRLFTSGVRVIRLNEKNPREYESRMVSVKEIGSMDGSHVFDAGGITKTDLILTTFWEVLTRVVMGLVHLVF